MLYYSFVFLLLAIVSGFLGFWGVAGTAAFAAKVLFGLFLVSFVVSLVVNMTAGTGGRKLRS